MEQLLQCRLLELFIHFRAQEAGEIRIETERIDRRQFDRQRAAQLRGRRPARQPPRVSVAPSATGNFSSSATVPAPVSHRGETPAFLAHLGSIKGAGKAFDPVADISRHRHAIDLFARNRASAPPRRNSPSRRRCCGYVFAFLAAPHHEYPRLGAGHVEQVILRLVGEQLDTPPAIQPLLPVAGFVQATRRRLRQTRTTAARRQPPTARLPSDWPARGAQARSRHRVSFWS